MSVNQSFNTAHDSSPEEQLRASLTTSEMDVLEALEDQPGYVLSKEKIREAAAIPVDLGETIVNVHICNINKKGRLPLGYDPVENRRGHGFIAMTAPWPSPEKHERFDLYGGAYIDRRNYDIVNGDNVVSLTPAEWILAERLFAHPGQISSQQRLRKMFEEKSGKKLTPNSVELSQIFKLRNKLKQVGLNRGIVETVWGQGWRANLEPFRKRDLVARPQ